MLLEKVPRSLPISELHPGVGSALHPGALQKLQGLGWCATEHGWQCACYVFSFLFIRIKLKSLGY